MTKSEYLDLVEKIRHHDILYYIDCKPEISDYDYDMLYKRLLQIEDQHPEWIVATSPSQIIKDSLNKGFKQAKHKIPMLSLSNTYSKEELVDFFHRMEKFLEKKDPEFCCELKMDGLAVSLHYENGFFTRGVTRGDGTIGDDVTANIRTIKGLPLKLKGNTPSFIEIRAEVYMPLEVFQQLNNEKEEQGQQVYANPRNAAAGSLKLLDPKEVYARKLSIMTYSIEGDTPLHSQHEVHHQLKKWGLPTFSEKHFAKIKSIDELMDFANAIQDQRHKLPFEIDGIVVKLDQLKEREYIGYTAKSPRWAVAYKFAAEQAQTQIQEITVQVGRTGVLTPVAELTPVFVSGSKISRATLHNADEIKRKDIRVSDFVIIEKGGDVIPKVVSVIEEKRDPHSLPWEFPTKCPMCETPTVHFSGEVAVRCPNVDHCPGQQLQRIIFFASKKAMNIEHLGKGVIERLVTVGLVKSIPDIFRLQKDQLLTLEGFKEKSVGNLLQSIEKAKNCELYRFLLALGIKYVGEGTAEILANHYPSIELLSKATAQEIESLEGLGPKVAQAVVEFFNTEKHIKEIDELISLGIQPTPPQYLKNTEHKFAGKTFVLTGTLENYTRTEAAKLIKDRGGKVSGSVSSKTDYVLAGKEAGSKLTKAEKLGVSIMTEKDFADIL